MPNRAYRSTTAAEDATWVAITDHIDNETKKYTQKYTQDFVWLTIQDAAWRATEEATLETIETAVKTIKRRRKK